MIEDLPRVSASLTKQRLLEIVMEELGEAYKVADILDNKKQEQLVRMTLWACAKHIVERCCVPPYLATFPRP